MEPVTILTASRILAIPYRTLNVWAATGALPFRREGRYRLVTLADVMRVATARQYAVRATNARRRHTA